MWCQVTNYIVAVQGAINTAPPGFRHLLHVDGPFWDGCWRENTRNPPPTATSSMVISERLLVLQPSTTRPRGKPVPRAGTLVASLPRR